MFFQFISLEWKSFIRSASFKTNLGIKVLIGFIGIYTALMFLAFGYFVLDYILEQKLEPVHTLNRYMFYYLLFDLGIRFLFQKLPVTHIRPLLSLPIPKGKIAKYTLFKSFNSFFMWIPIFFLIPLSLRLINLGFDSITVLFWTLSIFGFLAINNLLNLLLQNKNSVMIIITVLAGVTVGIHYFTEWDYLYYTGLFFELFYYNSWLLLLVFLTFIGLAYLAYRNYLSNLFLDSGVAIQTKNSKNWNWIENLSTKDPFLQNDIRLLVRNKRSKSTLFISLLFLCYGLMFFKDIQVFEISSAFSLLIFSLIITGGFIFTFGQYVPSWDSAYYPLLMSQNIPYKSYLESKWRIMVVGGLITSLLSLLYLLMDIQLIYPLLAAIAYNLGINTQLALLTGAYIRTPIDLSQNKNIFGDRKAFNLQTMLMSLPMFLLPILLFIIPALLGSPKLGYVAIIVLGILGFIFKNIFFSRIEKLYKKYKYTTLSAYKQSN